MSNGLTLVLTSRNTPVVLTALVPVACVSAQMLPLRLSLTAFSPLCYGFHYCSIVLRFSLSSVPPVHSVWTAHCGCTSTSPLHTEYAVILSSMSSRPGAFLACLVHWGCICLDAYLLFMTRLPSRAAFERRARGSPRTIFFSATLLSVLVRLALFEFRPTCLLRPILTPECKMGHLHFDAPL